MIFSALSANRQSYVKQGSDSNDKNMNGNCSLNQLVCIIIWLLEFFGVSSDCKQGKAHKLD